MLIRQAKMRRKMAAHYGTAFGEPVPADLPVRVRKPRVVPVTASVPAQRRTQKKDHCERCGFVAEIPAQLDCLPTLETLCANCHRLEQFRYGLRTGS